MSKQNVNIQSRRKLSDPKFRTALVCLFLILSAVTAFALQQAWLTTFLLIEVIFIVGCVELLARNLPRRLQRQLKLNAHRADGSRSDRRSEIERIAIRGFKFNTAMCFAFTLIPMHACWFAYWFFLPQINRFRATVVLNEEDQWMQILLEPVVHIILLLSFFALASYDSLKAVYFRALKDLDEQICSRADRYAVHDLIHQPQKKNSRRRRKKSRREKTRSTSDRSAVL